MCLFFTQILSKFYTVYANTADKLAVSWLRSRRKGKTLDTLSKK